VFRIVLNFGRALSPFKIVCFPEFEHCLWAKMHGSPFMEGI
jgi:hypothetical protein